MRLASHLHICAKLNKFVNIAKSSVSHNTKLLLGTGVSNIGNHIGHDLGNVFILSDLLLYNVKSFTLAIAKLYAEALWGRVWGNADVMGSVYLTLFWCSKRG